MGSVETQHCIAPQVEAEILAIFASIFQENAPRQASENADLKVTRKLAEKGNAGAQIQLGFMYYFGDGAPQNYSEARAWCLNAAAFDVCEAQSLLGLTCCTERGRAIMIPIVVTFGSDAA